MRGRLLMALATVFMTWRPVLALEDSAPRSRGDGPFDTGRQGAASNRERSTPSYPSRYWEPPSDFQSDHESDGRLQSREPERYPRQERRYGPPSSYQDAEPRGAGEYPSGTDPRYWQESWERRERGSWPPAPRVWPEERTYQDQEWPLPGATGGMRREMGRHPEGRPAPEYGGMPRQGRYPANPYENFKGAPDAPPPDGGSRGRSGVVWQ
ncbi:MAG: hypothetical protein HQL96_13640 [Magnetococcales bacterium]|nr:hypothetical protein [Magnetococcales bacterium]